MKRRLVLVPLALVAVVAVALTQRGDGADADVLVVAGTVEATEADVGFAAGGRIVDVLVDEGDRVHGGQVLARLDAAELEARRAAAQAQAGVARAQLAELRRGARPEEVAQARAVVQAADERLADARRDASRARALHDAGAISRQDHERATTLVAVLEAQRSQAAEQLLALERGARAERIEAAGAQLRQAEAAAEQADALLAYATASAPWAGLVTQRHREPGETVAPGAPVVTVLNPDDRWVRVYIGEGAIGRLAVGQAATIHADGLPDVAFEGRVAHIASEAEFTPRNVQTPEERSRLVYAVRVRVLSDAELRLKPGLPVDVRLRLAAPAGSAP